MELALPALLPLGTCPHGDPTMAASRHNPAPTASLPSTPHPGLPVELVGPSWFISPLWSPELTCTAPRSWDRAVPMLPAPPGLCLHGLRGGDSPSVLHPHPPRGLVLC